MDDRNRVIKKSNRLVEGIYDVTLWEMRVLLIMLSRISRYDNDFKEYTLDLKDFKKEFDLANDGRAYQRIKKACDDLMEKKIIVRNKLEDGTVEETKINMITDYTRNLNRSTYIKISFHPKMKPYLLQLKTEFLKYEFKNVAKLPTPYAIRIYELAKQYQVIGNRMIDISELKTMLRVENKYKQYSHLRTRILEPSIIHINEYTDINLSYEEIKSGKKVVKLKFIITPKKTIVEAKSEVVDKSGLYEKVSIFGIKEVVFKKWLDQYGVQHILDRVGYMNSQEGIENKGGYLVSIMGKEIASPDRLSNEEITKRVNRILFSQPSVEAKVRTKHGTVSQEAMNKIIMKMYPDKFKN